MATRGIFQLQTLKIFYCEYGGSSRAIRDFVSSGRIINWAVENPQIQVELKVRNGKHPFVEGEYASGQPKQIGIKNEDTKRIYQVIEMLKNSSGRKMTRLNRPVITQTPSVQGVWTPMLNLKDVKFDIQIVSGTRPQPPST